MKKKHDQRAAHGRASAAKGRTPGAAAAHGPVIAQNRKAWHDYFIEQKFEAGLVLTGWEVKSLRAGRGQLKEGYVVIENSEAWLVGVHISPLPTASTHVQANPTRKRKLLLHAEELDKLIGATERKGLHAGAAAALLAARPRQARNRPGARQAGARQAHRHQKTRNRPGNAARLEIALIAHHQWGIIRYVSGGDTASTWAAKSPGHAEVQSSS